MFHDEWTYSSFQWGKGWRLTTLVAHLVGSRPPRRPRIRPSGLHVARLGEPRRTPTVNGWGSLNPDAPPPAVLHLDALDLPRLALLLTDMSLCLRRHPGGAAPLVVARDRLAEQRLLASSGVPCVAVPSLAMRGMAGAVESVGPWGQVWVGMEVPPAPLLPRPMVVPLVAAMSRARTLEQAAGWCGYATRTVNRLLAEVREWLGLPWERRCPSGWVSAVVAGLGVV